MPEEVDNTGKDLVLQLSVKHAQKMDCGGGYIKLIPTSRCPSLPCKLLTAAGGLRQSAHA